MKIILVGLFELAILALLLLSGCTPQGIRYISTQSASIMAVRADTGERVQVFFAPGSPFVVKQVEEIHTPPADIPVVAYRRDGLQ